MDVTPRELREIDFRTEWKGYHRDDVDDLLERAAATIESQHERVRQLSERTEALQVETTQAAPASRETEDMLRRTLVLAQRTADEAVAEAQTEARRITDEADSHARRVVSEAEANARRVAEGERQRLEAEVLDLGARREALLADVEQLERFANDYRARLRSAIERDLDTLATRPPVVDSPRPRLHEVDIPTGNNTTPPPPVEKPAAGAAASSPPPATASPAPAPSSSGPSSSGRPSDEPASSRPAPAPPATPTGPRTPGADAPPARPAPAPEPAAPAASTPPPPTPAPPSTPAPPAGGRDEEPPASRAAPPTQVPHEPERTIELDKAPPFAPAPAPPRNEPLEAEVLDDDAFFASLREAVRDDTPLGPRTDEPDVALDDADENGRFGNVFKRRR